MQNATLNQTLEKRCVLILTMGIRMELVVAAVLTRNIHIGVDISMTVTSIPSKCAAHAEEARPLCCVKITSTLEDQMKICCSLVISHKEKSARPHAKETLNVSFSCG